MIMCVLLCYPVSIHMSQLQATGRPISSFICSTINHQYMVFHQYITSIWCFFNKSPVNERILNKLHVYGISTLNHLYLYGVSTINHLYIMLLK